ncbi:MAG TPA: hypothetical protein VII92_02700, partial [Anaerolineae bacterium]
MIAIALMLLLMIGINLVFRMAGQAVGAGQAISDAMRNAQAAQTVMQRDFSAMAVKDGPCIQIFSHIKPAFRNRQDQLTDADTNVQTWDELRTGTETNVVAAYPSNRSHRVDSVSFFGRDVFRRQTGNDGVFVADMGSNEAWVWYGHLRLYDGSGPLNDVNSFPVPGEAPAPGNPNPNNFFATQWILGRLPILLVEKNADTLGSGTLNSGGGQIFDNSSPPVAQGFIDRNWTYGQAPGDVALGPLNYNSGVMQYGSDNTPAMLRSSRFDLAATTIDGYRARLRRVIDEQATGWPWWNQRF